MSWDVRRADVGSSGRCYSIYADIWGKQGRVVEGSEMEGSNRAICPINSTGRGRVGFPVTTRVATLEEKEEEGLRCCLSVVISNKSAECEREGITTRRRRGWDRATGRPGVEEVLTFKPWLVNGEFLVQPCANCRDSCASKKRDGLDVVLTPLPPLWDQNLGCARRDVQSVKRGVAPLSSPLSLIPHPPYGSMQTTDAVQHGASGLCEWLPGG